MALLTAPFDSGNQNFFSGVNQLASLFQRQHEAQQQQLNFEAEQAAKVQDARDRAQQAVLDGAMSELRRAAEFKQKVAYENASLALTGRERAIEEGKLKVFQDENAPYHAPVVSTSSTPSAALNASGVSVPASGGFSMHASGNTADASSVSQDAKQWIKGFEGFDPVAKKDGAQYSVGWGTRAASPDEHIDPQTAESRLDGELSSHAARIVQAARAAGLNLTQPQQDALVSYDFNTGRGVDAINGSGGNAAAVAEAIRLGPVIQGGEILPGLQKRRESEYARFVSGSPAQQVAAAVPDPGQVLAQRLEQQHTPRHLAQTNIAEFERQRALATARQTASTGGQTLEDVTAGMTPVPEHNTYRRADGSEYFVEQTATGKVALRPYRPKEVIAKKFWIGTDGNAYAGGSDGTLLQPKPDGVQLLDGKIHDRQLADGSVVIVHPDATYTTVIPASAKLGEKAKSEYLQAVESASTSLVDLTATKKAYDAKIPGTKWFGVTQKSVDEAQKTYEEAQKKVSDFHKLYPQLGSGVAQGALTPSDAAPAPPATQGARPDAASILAAAKAAIASGKDPEAVKKRLQENGIDPSGL